MADKITKLPANPNSIDKNAAAPRRIRIDIPKPVVSSTVSISSEKNNK